MSDDLNYIDQLAFAKLNGFRVIPVSNPCFMQPSGSGTEKTVASGLKVKTILFVSKKIVWFSALIIGVAGISLFALISKDEKPEQKINEQQMPVEIKNDSVCIDSTKLFREAAMTGSLKPDTVKRNAGKEETDIGDSTKYTKVVHRQVVMKKVITVRKGKIVADTIKKTDTLQIK
jgi:hypothetical protein